MSQLNRQKTISTQQAKDYISIVDYLSKHGYSAVKMSGKRHCFKSVFREEKDPSMFVDDELGLWNDFGEGGGSIIDLAMKLHNFPDVSSTLVHLADFVGGEKISTGVQQNHSTLFHKPSENLTNIQVRPLNHFVLLKYLREVRGISEKIAKRYLKLVWYENNGRKGLFAIGWKNDSGFYELRGAGQNSFKSVTGVKDITTIKNSGEPKIFIFESMIDFLSVEEMKKGEIYGTFIILNSTSLVKRLIPYIEKTNPQSIFTFFDNDKGGREALKKLREGLPNFPNINQQTFYQDFEDVNDFWVAQLKAK